MSGTRITHSNIGGLFLASVLATVTPAIAHDDGHFVAGEPGVPNRPAKVVEIVMSDADGHMVYKPDRLKVARGEQIKFVIRNHGALAHEFVLGDKSENRAHAQMMASMPDMKHDDPNAKTLEPGESSSLVWRFSREGEFEFACLFPGHYEAGMHGVVVVK